MEHVKRLRSRADLEQLKLPIGFIRLVELVFALIAYVSMHSFDFDLDITCNYSPSNVTSKNYTIETLSIHQLKFTRCDGTSVPLFTESFGSGANFFHYVSVLTLLVTVGAILVYSFWWSHYVSDDRLPVIDLVIVALVAVGWLIGTFVFSKSAANVEEATQKENVGKLLEKAAYCTGAKTCSYNSYAIYQPLIVAVVAGMGCLFLHVCNIWFVYKETANFRDRNSRTMQIQQDPYTLE